ncbi:MAG: hypothetical protein IJP09_01570 [Clostridia bacterium]|nr:hypothetical protein [Clostridia bacterium]
MNGQTIRTFLSANSANGFFSFFDEFLKGKHAFVIKGGPGTGKSSLMKKLASAAVAKGNFTEYVYCSSDPDSLDGVYIYETETVFTDGTPPHVMEPKYPGVMGGIIDVGQFLSKKALDPAKEDILWLSGKIQVCYARAYRYLKAASCASSELRATAQRYLDSDAMLKYFQNLLPKIFREKKGDGGKTYVRFLSGITPKGFVTFKDTIYTLCADVFVVKDKYGIGAPVFEYVKKEAIDRGFDVYEFHAPLEPERITHVAIPQLDVAFVTSDKLTCFEARNARTVNLSRFIAETIDPEAKHAVAAAKLLKICLEEAVDSISTAKSYHDDLEEIYISAMDFAALDKFAEKWKKII